MKDNIIYCMMALLFIWMIGLTIFIITDTSYDREMDRQDIALWKNDLGFKETMIKEISRLYENDNVLKTSIEERCAK